MRYVSQASGRVLHSCITVRSCGNPCPNCMAGHDGSSSWKAQDGTKATFDTRCNDGEGQNSMSLQEIRQ